MSRGCDCTELCSMGPTCPGGMLAGLPDSGCWRTQPACPACARDLWHPNCPSQNPPADTAPESGEGRCGSDGGRGIGAGHRCTCNRKAGHPLDSKRSHGCSCGAPWGCLDCVNAEPDEGCAACGAAPSGEAAEPDPEAAADREGSACPQGWHDVSECGPQ